MRQKRGNMAQLLSAGFTRLFKNKLFWIGNLLMAGFFVFLVIQNYRSALKYPDIYYYTADTMMFAPFQIIGIFASCFTGMFLGTEYSDGTLRNKLVIGRTRIEVYLSNLILSFLASLFVSMVSILVTFALGIALFGAPMFAATKLLEEFMLGVLMLAAFAGIFTLLSMLISSRSISSVVCILFFFLLLIAATYINSRLDAREFVSPSYILSVDGVIQPSDPIPNPLYLQGMKRKIYEFFQALLPTAQGSLLMAHAAERPLVMAACSLGIMICTTVSGIFHFNRKNLN